MNNCFKDNLRRIINEQDICIKFMAYDLDVSLKTVYGWEYGAGTPNFSMLIELADYLGVTVDELIR